MVVALAVKNKMLQPQEELIKEKNFQTDGLVASKARSHLSAEVKENVGIMLHEADIPSFPLHRPVRSVQHQKPFRKKDRSLIDHGTPALLLEKCEIKESAVKRMPDDGARALKETSCLVVDIKTDEALEKSFFPKTKNNFSALSSD